MKKKVKILIGVCLMMMLSLSISLSVHAGSELSCCCSYEFDEKTGNLIIGKDIENKNIEAEMIDISNFKDIKEKYKIMSVPAIIINDNEVHFGAKKIDEIIDFIR
mgnify:CR=1 FL=1